VARKPYRNVVVCQRSCGTADTRRSPLRAQPGVCDTLGLFEEHQSNRVNRWLKLGPGAASLDYVLTVLLFGPEALF
jgi:hypothetical protein